MKKVKKLKLAELSVKSFVTKNNNLLQETIKGGQSVLGPTCASNDLTMISFFASCTYNTLD